MSLFNALIRTHHITSRKKVAKLRQAADACDIFALLRYGGCPGIMYVEGKEKGVREWVDAVHNLRYKDYQLVSRPAVLQPESLRSLEVKYTRGLHESDTVKDFGAQMHERNVYDWWRRGMGFASDSNIK